MAKTQINFRASAHTTDQLAELIKKTRMTQTEVIAVAIDRMHQEEIDMNTEKTYSITAFNSQGAHYAPGIDYDHPYGGARYTSVSAAVAAARRELAAGWHVQIIDDDGNVVKKFTVR